MTLIVVTLLTGAAALAHHSFAMFDQSKTVVVTGTFKKAELGNPHTWYWVAEALPDGTSKLWGVEGGGTSQIRTDGMPLKDYFAPGQKVTLTLHPLRDGRAGGQLVSIRFEDGRLFGGPSLP
jgi:hypothetical protein